jgi:toxin HigB-1
MDLSFKSKKLVKCFEKHEIANREWPDPVATKYTLRVKQIQIARSLEDLKALPVLRVHKLTGNRKGQWALTIHEKWRLIFEVIEVDGIEVIHILEVSNHYGD